eukprot:9179282-Heterocapsa_arctica.AAC.1
MSLNVRRFRRIPAEPMKNPGKTRAKHWSTPHLFPRRRFTGESRNRDKSQECPTGSFAGQWVKIYVAMIGE